MPRVLTSGILEHPTADVQPPKHTVARTPARRTDCSRRPSRALTSGGSSGVTINLGPSENVVCIFTNARVSSLLWGDVDCDGFVNSIDALRILRFVAHLSLTPIAGSPDVGADVQIS